jgi:hypothetical protein
MGCRARRGAYRLARGSGTSFRTSQPPDRAVGFRIGVDIGDAIADGTDLHGDAVNVVARLQAASPPGCICVSRSVRDHVHGLLGVAFEELGILNLKNIARPVEAFVVRLDAAKMPHSRVIVPGRGSRLLGVENACSHADRLPAEPAPAHHNNLPRLANALIGRECDVAEIEALLSRYRLVTLVGVAGVGKTSRSLRVGANLLARFPDGVWIVELAPLDGAELICEAVAAVFGLLVLGERPATDAIAAFLRSRRVLLILDNCEHVIAAGAKLANALLKTCPGEFLLASREEALSVAGEHAYTRPLSEGFRHFDTSMPAPVASGWSGCRAGLAPAGKAPPFYGARGAQTVRLWMVPRTERKFAPDLPTPSHRTGAWDRRRNTCFQTSAFANCADHVWMVFQLPPYRADKPD